MSARLRYSLPLACTLLALAMPAAQAINCARASTAQEHAICDNPELKAHDDALTQMYASIRAEFPPDFFAIVRADQIEWIKARDARCGANSACLLQETRERTVILNEYAKIMRDALRESQQQSRQQPQTPATSASAATRAPRTANTPRAGENILNPQEIYQVAARSSVVVLTYSQGRRISQGSGVGIVENIVATNCHVVEDGDQFAVVYESEVYPANIIAGDENVDYCLLYAENLPTQDAVIAGSDTLNPGQRVYSVGSPKGFELTIGDGLISGIRNMGEGVYMIQTSAPISSGSSGGGLFNEYGELIGITTAGHKDAENLNFAVPAEFAYVLMKDILEKSKRP